MKEQFSKLTANPIGAIGGAVAGYYLSKKLLKVENMWLLAGLTVVGAVLGANAQSAMKAKGSIPTAETVKK